MPINLETALALLLLPIVGSIPSAVGQNALTTTSDVMDLVDNVTEGGGEEKVIESPPPSESTEDQSSSPSANEADETQPANEADETQPANEADETQPANEADETQPANEADETQPANEADETQPANEADETQPANEADETQPVTAGESILINEVELNPRGNNIEEKEWIELYNPTTVDINISGVKITPSFQSPAIELPPDAVIEAGKTYVIELDRPILSNTGESLVLANGTGDILDRTPSLVDRSDDSHTWQRIPDGNNEWQFVENTEGNSNGDSETSSTTPDSVENTEGNPNNDPDTLSTILDSVYSGSEVECLGSAGCIQGVATRIVDGDTLYVESNSSTVHKVDLALIKAPSRSEEEMFAESTAFTRDLCLGSTVLVDEDDMLSASSTSSNSDILGVVYCSSTNLNSELLDNGYAKLETEQCARSEFANEPWVKDHGC